MFYPNKFNKRSPYCSNGCRSLETGYFYQPSAVDPFLAYEHVNVDGSSSTRVTSDIYMLFNQQRLDRMTREALIARFDSMSQYDDGMKTLRQKCTDDQLISLVKSRYIQSPGELMEWSKYLNSLADVELKNIVQQAQLNSTQVDVPSGDNLTPQDSAVTAS